ncbi:unnamed protein product [Moneuplotes crassus]|uniref:Uncharacterized protein n=1 Tax=Euplotes crassus TaxID=5936 RepID=A0AAD1XFT5_EUPCR|nr:unnamed protein product [Moneuplotes crassus]
MATRYYHYIGGFIGGVALSSSIMCYIDDIVYVPIRRTFIKPIYSYYYVNYGTSNLPEENKSKMGVSDVITEISNKGGSYLSELRPRDVTGDRNTFVFKENDFKTREQHYFDYIAQRRMEQGDSFEKPDSTQQHDKYSNEDYKSLAFITPQDLMDKYVTNSQDTAQEYNEVFNSFDMIKIVQKKERKDPNTEALKERLEKIRKKNEFGSELLEQSEKYKVPDEREEARKSLAEAKKLTQIAMADRENITSEDVDQILSSYQGKYSVREVTSKDKSNLRNLRQLAKSDNVALPKKPQAPLQKLYEASMEAQKTFDTPEIEEKAFSDSKEVPFESKEEVPSESQEEVLSESQEEVLSEPREEVSSEPKEELSSEPKKETPLEPIKIETEIKSDSVIPSDVEQK